jgi:hypothetical protein
VSISYFLALGEGLKVLVTISGIRAFITGVARSLVSNISVSKSSELKTLFTIATATSSENSLLFSGRSTDSIGSISTSTSSSSSSRSGILRVLPA